MKLERLVYDTTSVLDFYEEGLTALGALCERTWHDRLQIVAELRAAGLWKADGSLHSAELHFAPAAATAARDAEREVFPGCPLTFRLAEELMGKPADLALEHLILKNETNAGPPEAAVAEKRWRAQFPDATRWKLLAPFAADFRFSLVALVRCEIQAIDQHWSLHRIAIGLPGGEQDENLARDIGFAQPARDTGVVWPKSDPTRWSAALRDALEQELGSELAQVLSRQEKSLGREIERIDSYFENYARELTARSRRTSSENTKMKSADRLAAASAEHARRRADQISRHEIRVIPRFDALLLVAESAWKTQIEVEQNHQRESLDVLYVPRTRQWAAA